MALTWEPSIGVWLDSLDVGLVQGSKKSMMWSGRHSNPDEPGNKQITWMHVSKSSQSEMLPFRMCMDGQRKCSYGVMVHKCLYPTTCWILSAPVRACHHGNLIYLIQTLWARALILSAGLARMKLAALPGLNESVFLYGSWGSLLQTLVESMSHLRNHGSWCLCGSGMGLNTIYF